jgi:glycosyltransferase involved in cell wall biosynthesis
VEPGVSVLVSVAMPAYNAAATIAAAIDSVLAQSFPDFELIVVDDGSTDATAGIVRAYADPRVHLLQQPTKGDSAARNRAIAEARGELLAFLDADDLWQPDKLALQVAQLRARPEVGLSYTAQTIIDGQGRAIDSYGVKPAYRGRCLDALLRSNGLGLSTVLARTALVRALGGFDETLAHCEDWDLWIRIAERAELDYVDQPLTRYRFHPGNATRNLDRLRAAQLRVLARNRERFGARADSAMAHFLTYSGYARRYMLAGQAGKGLADTWRALRARPLTPSAWFVAAKLLLYPLLRRRDPNVAAQLADER